MSIFEELIQRVSEGEYFHVDFEKRNMRVGKDFLIKEGQYEETQELLGEAFGNVHCLEDLFFELECLYRVYKYSLPSERSDNKRKKYFKALPLEEITDKELIYAERREVAQAILEGFVLCMILTGKLVWDEKAMNGKWFYQSKTDPDLVVLRSWVEGK
jgi:hypothetical protein